MDAAGDGDSPGSFKNARRVQLPGEMSEGEEDPMERRKTSDKDLVIDDDEDAPYLGAVDDSREMGVNLVQLEEFLAVGRGLRRSCGTLPLTLALWVSYVFVVWQHTQAWTSFESARFIRDGIEGCYLTLPGSGSNVMRLVDIKEHRQIIPWIDQALVPALQARDQMQVLLGHVRVTQTRGENVSTCAGLGDDLQAFYASGCYPAGGVVGTYGPAREAFELPELAFIPVPGSTNKYQMWLEVNRSRDIISQRLQRLEREGWVDLSTQDITIEGLYLNVEAHVYSQFTVLFTFHREGSVETRVTAYPLRGEVFGHWSQIFLDIVWLVVFVVLLYQATIYAFLEVERDMMWLHFRDPYLWMDFFMVIVGAVVVIIFYYYVYWLDKFTDEVFNLGVMPELSVEEAPADRKVQAGVEAQAYQDQLTNIIDWFEWFLKLHSWTRFCSVIYATLMVGRFFRGFTGQPRMSVLVQTFLCSAGFIIHYFVLLAIVFACFTVGGFLLFGEEIQGWSTPGNALGRILLVFFMRFDYEEFHSVAPISAAIWFSSFFVLVVVLLQRLLAAAIVDRYCLIRAALGEPGQGITDQVRGWLKDLLWQRTYEGAQKSVPYDDLLRMIAKDTDPAHIKKLGTLQVDRRLRSRADLHRVETSQTVTMEFLIARGCDPATAQRLLDTCSAWTHSISTSSSPIRRLMIMVARQMNHVRYASDQVNERMMRKFERSSKVVDRVDLKHAKCLSLARRIRKAQQLPPGWSAHTDKDGRRYLRQEETGLTSWTLPKHML